MIRRFVLPLLLVLWASLALALTPAQKATLKAATLADPAALAYYQTGDLSGLAEWWNAQAAPDFWVWKTRLTRAEAVQGTSVDGTMFAWTGTGFITRSQGERDAWREMWNHELACNPSLPNVRAAFQDIFSGGTAPAPANRTHLLAMARRVASRLEKLFATGTGTTASPGTMTVEGPLSYSELIGL